MNATDLSHPAASNLKHSVKLLSKMSLAGYNFIRQLQDRQCARCIPGEPC